MAKKVVVNGGCGRMGREVIKTVVRETDSTLVGVYDIKNVGKNIKKLLGLQGNEVFVNNDLQEIINRKAPDVLIDFTAPETVRENIITGLKNNVDLIVGTTGLTEPEIEEIEEFTTGSDGCVLLVPNFALGAVLMMQFARKAAAYFPDVEIIEMHHRDKIDAPSGTSMRTADLINKNRRKEGDKGDKIEKLAGARGGKKDGVHIHSIRLPGLVAHQQVIFGGEGQSLTLRHDSFDRSSFMPGVRLALRKIDNIEGLVIGLENIM